MRRPTRIALRQGGFKIIGLVANSEKDRIAIHKYLFGEKPSSKSIEELKAIAHPRLVALFKRILENRDIYLQLRGSQAFWELSGLNLHGAPNQYLRPKRVQTLVNFYSQARSNWTENGYDDDLTRAVDEFNVMKRQAEQLPPLQQSIPLQQLTLSPRPLHPPQQASTDATNHTQDACPPQAADEERPMDMDEPMDVDKMPEGRIPNPRHWPPEHFRDTEMCLVLDPSVGDMNQVHPGRPGEAPPTPTQFSVPVDARRFLTHTLLANHTETSRWFLHPIAIAFSSQTGQKIWYNDTKGYSKSFTTVNAFLRNAENSFAHGPEMYMGLLSPWKDDREDGDREDGDREKWARTVPRLGMAVLLRRRLAGEEPKQWALDVALFDPSIHYPGNGELWWQEEENGKPLNDMFRPRLFRAIKKWTTGLNEATTIASISVGGVLPAAVMVSNEMDSLTLSSLYLRELAKALGRWSGSAVDGVGMDTIV